MTVAVDGALTPRLAARTVYAFFVESGGYCLWRFADRVVLEDTANDFRFFLANRASPSFFARDDIVAIAIAAA